MIVAVMIVLILLAWLYKVLNPSGQLKRMGEKIPGPRSWPVVGNGLLFRKSNHVLRTLLELQRTYGPVVRLWHGKQLLVVLSDADDIKALLTSAKHLNKGFMYRLLDPWLGSKNILTGEPDVWRAHRLTLNPSFTSKALRTYLPIMQTNTTIIIEQLETEVDGEEFNIQPYLEKCTLDIIGEAVMGVKLKTQKSENTPYERAIRSMLQIYIKRLISPWLHNERIFRLTSLGRRFNAEAKLTGDFIHEIITERQMNLEKEAQGAVREKQKVLLDQMLQDGNFTDEEIRSEAQSLVFAGHDTLMFTISFCMFELSQNPVAQEKAYQEVQELFSRNKEQELTYADYIHELKYLENVINETMRMHTVVHTISRYIAEDFVLPSGFTIPKGSEANCFLLHLHGDERYFPNANQFMPERFETKNDFTDFSFVPFSAGPRSCIGQKFAMLEMKVVISALLRAYQFLPSEKVKTVEVKAGAMLVASNGIPVRLTSRKHVTSEQ